LAAAREIFTMKKNKYLFWRTLITGMAFAAVLADCASAGGTQAPNNRGSVANKYDREKEDFTQALRLDPNDAPQ
jgi:hypothetical protein